MNHNINRNTGWQWLFVLILLCLFTLPIKAAIPDNIDYQGYLTDDVGSPVDGTTFITFSLYNINTGGIALWTDTLAVDVNNGLFTVKLGGITAPPFPAGLFDDPLWLGIDVNGDGEMTPRIEFSSAAFAHMADDALTLEGQTVASLDQSAHVADSSNPHSVTAAQVDAISSASFTLHSGDTSAHHSKTTSFTELTDTASDAQLPASMTRDTELASEISTHAGDASAHHGKTTSFSDLTDQATDGQIPNSITINQAANADTLDGLDSTDFISASTDNWVNTSGDTMSGNLNVLARIGIGTLTPTSLLDIRGSVAGHLAYFYNDHNVSGEEATGIYVIGDASHTGTGAARGGTFSGVGGNISGVAYGSFNQAVTNGSSPAYGVFSYAEGGGPAWAFYGLGDGYISGNVGIGTTTPASKLAVSGGVTIGSAYDADTLTDGYLAISDRVGIGTTTPAFSLDVRNGTDNYIVNFENDNNSTGPALGIRVVADAYDTETGYSYGEHFSVSGGRSGGTAWGAAYYVSAYGSSHAYGVYSNATMGDTTGNQWAFYGHGDAHISGNVGIGTDSPFFKIEVEDDQSFNPVARFTNTNTGSDADGIGIRIGPDTNPGTANRFIKFYDGDNTQIAWVSGDGAGGVNYSTTSDERLKSNIVDFGGGLDLVSRIKVRQYEFIEAPGKEQIGFLAQELQSVLPQVVSGDPNVDVDIEPMGIDYGRITPVLVAAIQELMAENRALKKTLKENNETLKEEIKMLRQALGL